MSTVLTEQQAASLIETAAARRCTSVPHAWVVTRLQVVVDARPAGLLVEAQREQARRLLAEVGDAGVSQVMTSTHGHEHAAQVFAEMRQQLTAEPRADQPRLSLAHEGAIAAAAEHLAAHPHGQLLITVAVADGHALAARWS